MSRTKPVAVALMASPDDTEQQFYEALQRGDLERLMAVWSDDDDIVCVHPGGTRAVGAAMIRATFEAIFRQGPVHAVPEETKRVVTHSCAVHSVLERVRVESEQGVHSGWAVATNVYLKTAEGWRLVLHHASQADSADAPEPAPPTAVLH